MEIITKEIEAKNIINKSNLPLGGYSINPYVGCPHACKYCYACFMKRFTGHKEEWGTFLDIKNWSKIKNPKKYKGEILLIGSVTDPYNPLEEKYLRTKMLIEQLKNSGGKLMICTKSDLILRDLDLLKSIPDVTVSFSINTLDEDFKKDMDEAVSIERRLNAMKEIYNAGIRTVCFVSPIFPKITDVFKIIDRVKEQCDFVWLENLNLRGSYKGVILDYIKEKYPEFMPIYKDLYSSKKKSKTYWKDLEKNVELYCKENNYEYIINYLPDGRSEKGRPKIINYFYHEEIRGSQNQKKINK